MSCVGSVRLLSAACGEKSWRQGHCQREVVQRPGAPLTTRIDLRRESTVHHHLSLFSVFFSAPTLLSFPPSRMDENCPVRSSMILGTQLSIV